MKDVWIQTYTGKKFHPFAPRPEEICLEEIAHALSMICRYGGHTDKFYSVAQHSILMCNLGVGDRSWLLMHDAAEAYIGDIVLPLKRCLPEMAILEEMILNVVAEKFGMTPISETNWLDIHKSDIKIGATEKRDLLHVDMDWDIELPEPYDYIIKPISQQEAKKEFLDLAGRLGIKECI